MRIRSRERVQLSTNGRKGLNESNLELERILQMESGSGIGMQATELPEHDHANIGFDLWRKESEA